MHLHAFIWVFPKIGVSQNGWHNGKPYFLMGDLGGKPTIFGNILNSFMSIGHDKKSSSTSAGFCKAVPHGRDRASPAM